ncbi:Pumilio -like protein 3 [Halotydeus destructor]|nr:Pumilio -like protein 3 [Halotydeus destructor]
MKLELVESLKEVVVELVHTKDGARVAMECLWASPAKERKSVLKSFRKFVPKMVEEEHGYLVLLAAFDCVDDTKLIDKTILVELFSTENALSLAQYKNGLKVLHYLLTPRDSRHFHKDVVAILEAGDKNPHSKKEVDIRRKELLEASSPHLFRLVANHADVLVQNNGCALLMIDILTLAVDSDGLKAAAMDKIVSIIASEGLYHSAKEDSNRHPIERDGLGLFLSKMVSKEADKFAAEKKNGVYFSSKLADKVSKEVLRSYIGCNKGCFVLLKLIETKIPSVVTKVTSALQGVNRTLAQKDYKGASLLLEKLKASK